MRSRVARVILGLCSLILALGGLAHAKAFRGAQRAIGAAHLPAIYGNDFKALWLADSATLLTVAALYAMIAARPSVASRTLLMMISGIPAATAIFIYMFVGNFYAGHLLLAAAGAAAFSAIWLPAQPRHPERSEGSRARVITRG